MSNFIKFITEDIEAKKTLLSTMPTNNKRNIKKYNEKIDFIIKKYKEYKERVKKYIDTKSKSFHLKCEDKNLNNLTDDVNNLEYIRFILNPLNTFFEKMGFDNLLYKINSYKDLNFHAINDVINQFLNKFEIAGIKLTIKDFNYTCYVNEYMISFLGLRDKKSENYDELSEIFEKIYWVNPEIIEHIELNFRKLIKKHEKEFNEYIIKLQKEVMIKNKVSDYEDCLKKYNDAYLKLSNAKRENICDIIDLAKSGEIDVNNYFEESKFRVTAFNSLIIEPLNFEDKLAMQKFYESLEKLKSNIEEYANYVKFKPLFDDFKDKYGKLIQEENNAANKGLKDIETKILNEEEKLEKINKKIFKTEPHGIINTPVLDILSRKNKNLNQLKIDSINQANKLYELYKEYDQEYFKNKVLSLLNLSFTLPELLHLYYSFDYYKKMAIKEVFELTNYNEVVQYSDSFNLFAMNPTNIVINGVSLFEENDIAKVIINRYRLDNINLKNEDLVAEELEILLNKIQYILRINEIEKSSTTVEKIWFMAQVERFNRIENAGNTQS